MNRRQFLSATSCVSVTSCVSATSCLAATSVSEAAGAQADREQEAAVRLVIQRYVDAREASDSRRIEALFTHDADQLVSDGTWRRGREQLVQGMLESSRKNTARRTIDVQSVRWLTSDVAIADGRYVQQARNGGKDRVMWTSIVLKRASDGWRIAAIRNMLPAMPG